MSTPKQIRSKIWTYPPATPATPATPAPAGLPQDSRTASVLGTSELENYVKQTPQFQEGL